MKKIRIFVHLLYIHQGFTRKFFWCTWMVVKFSCVLVLHRDSQNVNFFIILCSNLQNWSFWIVFEFEIVMWVRVHCLMTLREFNGKQIKNPWYTIVEYLFVEQFIQLDFLKKNTTVVNSFSKDLVEVEANEKERKTCLKLSFA